MRRQTIIRRLFGECRMQAEGGEMLFRRLHIWHWIPSFIYLSLGAAPSEDKKTTLWIKAAYPLKSPRWIPRVMASRKLIFYTRFIEIFLLWILSLNYYIKSYSF